MVRQFFHRLGSRIMRVFDQPVRVFTSGAGDAGTSLGPVTAKNIVEPLGPNWFVEIR